MATECKAALCGRRRTPMDFLFEKVNVLCKKLESLCMTPAGEIGPMECVPCGYKKGCTPPAEGWQPFTPGSRVSGKDGHLWFHMHFTAPQAQEGKTPYFRLMTGKLGNWDACNPQALLYVNGRTVQGMDINHNMMQLTPGEDVDLYLYFYIGMIDIAIEFTPSLVYLDDRIEKAYYDLSVPLQGTRLLQKNSREYVETMKCLEQAANRLVMWPEYSEAFYQGLENACDYLQKEFYEKLCGKSDVTVRCIGHTHIDVAWRWTLAQTVEKSQRSFATVIELMRRYPEYIFMSSQPQLYQYVKEEDPALYEEIKEMIKAGRWEAEGAMWLEADCNLTSGESLVRQIIHGKKFMKDEFDVDSKTLWLPDVFGYSAAMPQILKKSGVDNFVTSKISWNEANTLPYDTFMWQGIDGTEVFTNFITAQDAKPNGEITNFTTYNGDLTPDMVLGTWNRYQQKEYNDEAVITFGYGDGGGGPTREMLERFRRLQYGLPGLPRACMSNSADWLNHARENFTKNAELLQRMPRWVGELYLEFHRGTYTSMAKNKKNNRKSEFALQQAEKLCATDALLNGGATHDDELYHAWEVVLRNQFHDIIPGSSIFEVYEDSDKEYAGVLATTDAVCGEKIAALKNNVTTNGGTFVYNPLGFARKAQVKVNGQTVETPEIPALGWAVIPQTAPVCGVQVNGLTVENHAYIVTLDEAGRIVRLFDKRFNREVLLDGQKGNEIQIFEDFPRQYDNWEITNYYKQKKTVLDTPATITAVTDGARAGLKIERKFLSSTISQTMWLYTENDRIDFETNLDWHEEHMLMKAAFPVDVHANRATYEIQFGNLERPTHENTSWDQAKFEVCAHKWADISEDGYGVSILSESKYGFNAEGSTMKITLLKCGTEPNPQADKGAHAFTYSLLPHAGDYRTATVHEAYCLNVPAVAEPVAAQTGKLPECFSLLTCDAPNVVIDTVKRAYNGDGTVVRMYDAFDRRTTAKLTSGFDCTRAVLCDLLENELEELPVENGVVSVPVKNFEIVTIKLK